jgi:hypothetical protein
MFLFVNKFVGAQSGGWTLAEDFSGMQGLAALETCPLALPWQVITLVSPLTLM